MNQTRDNFFDSQSQSQSQDLSFISEDDFSLPQRVSIDWTQDVSVWENLVLDPRSTLVNCARILSRCTFHLQDIINLSQEKSPIQDHAMRAITGVETCYDSIRIVLDSLCGKEALKLIDSSYLGPLPNCI